MSEGHPWFGRQKDEIDANVHCGVTSTLAFAKEEEQSGSIDLQPDEDELNKMWWVGFDCAHSLDLLPSQPSFPLPGVDFILSPWAKPVHRDMSYVARQVSYLAIEATLAQARGLPLA